MKYKITIFLFILVTILISSPGAVFAVEKNIVSSSNKAKLPFHVESDRYSANVLSGDNAGKKEPMLLALNCIKPIKPILPIKPIWCSGEWKLVLQCDQYCNCVWIPMCLE